MTDWQERITRGTAPAIRVEHLARYALAAPLIRTADVWVDLGCGNGVAAADALGDDRSGRIVLVDVDADAVVEAERELGGESTLGLVADLSEPADVARVVEGAGSASAGCITCFETVEHLARFPPLVSELARLSREAGWTVVLSVPNDAHGGVENPHHRTIWGESAMDELRRLLPENHLLLRQTPLIGSRIARGGEDTRHEIGLVLDGGRAPSHLLAAFGPRADELAATAEVQEADLDAHRAWERQRESDLAYFQAAFEQARADAARLADELDAWRRRRDARSLVGRFRHAGVRLRARVRSS